jgi:hypothetical protein
MSIIWLDNSWPPLQVIAEESKNDVSEIKNQFIDIVLTKIKKNHNRHIVHNRNNVFNIIDAFQIIKISADIFYCAVQRLVGTFSSCSMCSPDSYRDAYCGSNCLPHSF